MLCFINKDESVISIGCTPHIHKGESWGQMWVYLCPPALPSSGRGAYFKGTSLSYVCRHRAGPSAVVCHQTLGISLALRPLELMHLKLDYFVFDHAKPFTLILSTQPENRMMSEFFNPKSPQYRRMGDFETKAYIPTFCHLFPNIN